MPSPRSACCMGADRLHLSRGSSTGARSPPPFPPEVTAVGREPPFGASTAEGKQRTASNYMVGSGCAPDSPRDPIQRGAHHEQTSMRRHRHRAAAGGARGPRSRGILPAVRQATARWSKVLPRVWDEGCQRTGGRVRAVRQAAAGGSKVLPGVRGEGWRRPSADLREVRQAVARRSGILPGVRDGGCPRTNGDTGGAADSRHKALGQARITGR